MPDKQNENKFMAMLERTGIVRRADSEDESVEKETVGERSRPETDLRSLFGPPDGDSPKVTPAARQPIPGMSNPIMPGERKPQEEREQPKPPPALVSEPPRPKPPEVPEREAPKPPPEPVKPEEPKAPAEPVEREPFVAASVEDKPPTPIFGGFKPIIDEFKEDSKPAVSPEPVKPVVVFEPEPVGEPEPEPEPVMPVAMFEPEPVGEPSPVAAIPYERPQEPVYSPPVYSQPVYTPPEPAYSPPVYSAEPEPEFPSYEPDYFNEPDPVYSPPEPPVDNTTERYLEIKELYESLTLRATGTDTIYLIEEYLKTLPDSLPDQARRDIVGKIVAASGFDFDLLMGDGILRVKMLKEYAERFAQYTDDYVRDRQTELEELDQQMLRVRKLIENRRDLHKKQFLTIEAEAQRLKEILTFIAG